MDINNMLRKEIERSGLSHYRICKDTGIDKGAMSRFTHGERGFNLDYASRLLDYFGYEIKKKKQVKK